MSTSSLQRSILKAVGTGETGRMILRFDKRRRACSGAPVAHLRTQEGFMSRLVSLAAGLLLALATPTTAQSTLPKSFLSIPP
jgi:hypothetical protein